MSPMFDLRSPETHADPYPILRQLQDEDPVHWSESLGAWVLTRYEDVTLALKHPSLSADRLPAFFDDRQARSGDLRGLRLFFRHWFAFMDPPAHSRFRGLMNRAFASQGLDRLRLRAQAIADEILDRHSARSRMDVTQDFASPCIKALTAELVGVSAEDLEPLGLWSNPVLAFVGSALGGFLDSAWMTPDKCARADRAIDEVRGYFGHMIEARRAEPKEDLLSSLVTIDDKDGALSEDEIISACGLLLLAGHDTTTFLISNGLFLLLRNPDALDAWRRDRDRDRNRDPPLAVTGVEELLRLDGPIQALVRIATEDVELCGKRVSRGERVCIMVSAANHDPRQFDEPDRLDLRRTHNRHLGFGYGAHFCIGAALARLAGQIAITTLLLRFSNIELLIDAPPRIHSIVMRGIKSLPISFSS